MVKVYEQDIGCACMVQYEDMGRVECMLLGTSQWEGSYVVYRFCDSALDDHVEEDQIISIGKEVRPPVDSTE